LLVDNSSLVRLLVFPTMTLPVLQTLEPTAMLVIYYRQAQVCLEDITTLGYRNTFTTRERRIK
jgi:hypothetical protein